MGLPDDHIWWGGLCFMSLPHLLFSVGVLTSYLPCLSYTGCSVQHGEKGKTWIWGFQGLLTILGDQIIGWTMLFHFIHQRLHRIFKKKMFPRKSFMGSRFEIPWSDAQLSNLLSLSSWKSQPSFLEEHTRHIICVWHVEGLGKIWKRLQSREEELKGIRQQVVLW